MPNWASIVFGGKGDATQRMDGFERDRPDVDRSERTDEPFARWSAARQRARGDGGVTPESAGTGTAGPGATASDTLARTVVRLRHELENERQQRAEAEATAEQLARLVGRERDERLAAEERADAAFAELELATHASTGLSPSPRRRSRTKRALRRIKRNR